MLRNRVNRVLLTIGVGAALCAFPVALAAARAGGDTHLAPAATARIGAGAHSVRQIAFPVPSQGPPRQFPLPGPTPSPTATTAAPTTPAPPPPPAPAARPKPAAKPAPKPVVVKPAPKPKPKPPPKPIPKPAPQPPLPPTRYHAVPQRHLTTVLIVFLVAIVPVSLARVRR